MNVGGEGTLARAVEVVEDEIKSGKLERGRPQVCHMIMSAKIKLGESRENEVAAKSKDEECVGHRLYMEGHVFEL